MQEINLTQTCVRNESFLLRLEEESGQKVSQCYQCMKCTGGCPFAFTMDYPPSMIMRMLQIGLVEEVLSSFAIWTCATCSTCTTRCIRGIDIAKVMDTLRVIAYRQGVRDKGKNMAIFHSIFMNNVKNHGRLYELGLAINLNLRTGNLFKDAQHSPGLFLNGKVSPLPHNIKGRDDMKKLYSYAEKLEEDAR